MKNLVVLISGRGSNLEALIDTARAEDWAGTLGVRIAAVISNRPQVAGLATAQAAGITTRVVDHSAHASRESFDAELATVIDRFQPELVVLAGFMRVLTEGFVRHYEGRMINIHPSLLPAFPGMATHRQALTAGVRVHGATVHFVSAEVDAGAIVAQAVVPVWPEDDEASLAARVLEQEHRLYPRAVRALIEGQVSWSEGRVRMTPNTARQLTVFAQEADQ